jgi:hypothetical protein
MKVRRIEKVLLYDEGAAEELNIEEVAEYLREKLGEGESLCFLAGEKPRLCKKARIY